MQAFNDGPIAQRPKHVTAPDASLARKAALRNMRPPRLAHPRVMESQGDVRCTLAQRRVSGAGKRARGISLLAAQSVGGRHVAGSR